MLRTHEGPSRAWRVLQGVLRYANELRSLSLGISAVKKVLQMPEGASRARRVHQGFFRHMSSALYLPPLYSNNIIRGVYMPYVE